MSWETAQVYHRSALGCLVARAGFKNLADCPRYGIFGLEPEYYGFFYGYDPEWFVVDNHTHQIVRRGYHTIDEAKQAALELQNPQFIPSDFDVEALATELTAATAKFPRWAECVATVRRMYNAS